MNYIIANWKMNMDLKAITQWVQLYPKISSQEQTKIIIAPSAVHIPLMFEHSNLLGIEIAAQDVSVEEKGAHTGELGAFQVKGFCKYSIVGHSERHESSEVVIKKRDNCLANGITPIVCFVNPEDASKFYTKGALLAWEDPNNISQNGAYRDKDPKEIEEGVKSIRETIPSEAVLIYGGSVNRQNIKSLVKMAGIDGVLVGNASLDSEHFADIIKSF